VDGEEKKGRRRIPSGEGFTSFEFKGKLIRNPLTTSARPHSISELQAKLEYHSPPSNAELENQVDATWLDETEENKIKPLLMSLVQRAGQNARWKTNCRNRGLPTVC
jgi:hypothetical protein